MRKWVLGAGLACLASAAFASERPAPLPSSAAQDMKCAVWASLVVNGNEDPDVVASFTWAMYYFLGRYEGATGKDFGDAMAQTSAAIDADPASIGDIEDSCMAQWRDYLTRAQSWGDDVNSGEAAAATQ